MAHSRSIANCRSHSGVQLSGSAVGRVVTATVDDAGGAVDEGAIAGVHAVVHPLLPGIHGVMDMDESLWLIWETQCHHFPSHHPSCWVVLMFYKPSRKKYRFHDFFVGLPTLLMIYTLNTILGV